MDCFLFNLGWSYCKRIIPTFQELPSLTKFDSTVKGFPSELYAGSNDCNCYFDNSANLASTSSSAPGVYPWWVKTNLPFLS